MRYDANIILYAIKYKHTQYLHIAFCAKCTYAHCVDKYAKNNQQRFSQVIHLMCVNCSGKVKNSVFYRGKMKVI